MWFYEEGKKYCECEDSEMEEEPIRESENIPPIKGFIPYEDYIRYYLCTTCNLPRENSCDHKNVRQSSLRPSGELVPISASEEYQRWENKIIDLTPSYCFAVYPDEALITSHEKERWESSKTKYKEYWNNGSYNIDSLLPHYKKYRTYIIKDWKNEKEMTDEEWMEYDSGVPSEKLTDEDLK